MRWVLIGFSTSGKTFLKKHFLEKKNFLFLDTDELLEKKFSNPIAAIYENLEEKKFRDEETKILRELSKKSFTFPYVLATGGGIVERKENLFLLKSFGKILFLDINPKVLYERIQKKEKSRFKKLSFQDFMIFYERRKKLYLSWAEEKIFDVEDFMNKELFFE